MIYTTMFRDKKTSRGAAGSDREKHRSSSPKSRSSGAGRVSSGRVEKTQVTKSAPDRSKLKQAAKEIKNDSNYTVKNKNEQKQSAKDENSTAEKNEGVTYKQKMTIIPDPERKCVDTEIEQIKEALVDALEPLDDGCYPQFYNSHNVKGLLVLTCANEHTRRWLERTVPQLQPWEGAKLRVKLRGDDTQGPKVMLKTPKLFAKTEPKKILQMLSTQNKTLVTSTWKNVSVKSEASGQTLIYAIDDRTVEAIRALDNKAYLGLGNVELVILNSNEEEGNQTSENTKTKADKGDKKEVSDTKTEKESDKKTS